MKKKGLIQIYTGEGKGKTTAAVGLAVRANAQGMKVCFISFHKNPDKWGYGEFRNLKKLGVDVFCFAKCHPFCGKTRKTKQKIVEVLNRQCLESLDKIREIFKKNKYDMLILDEINICLRDGFLGEKDVLELIARKPEKLELVLTGRAATRKLIREADLVSIIKEIKHPYKKGVLRRRGIEY